MAEKIKVIVDTDFMNYMIRAKGDSGRKDKIQEIKNKWID